VIRLCVLDNGGLETLGVLDVDGLDVGVELLLGALLIVTLARDADTEAERNTLDTTLPDLLVQLGVEADVASAHGGLSEGLDLLDGAGSALLEGNTVNTLVQVDGVLASDNIGNGGTASLGLLGLLGGGHFYVVVGREGDCFAVTRIG